MNKVSIGSAQRPCRGEKVCGDAIVIVENGETTLIGVADGLGHGPKAAEASEAFCEYVRAHPQEGIEDLLWGAHDAIAQTRGVAAALVAIDQAVNRIDFVGIGNIELRAVSAEPIKPVSMPGVVGGNVRKLRPFSYDLSPGDLVVLFSDGVTRRLEVRGYQHLELTAMAERIVTEEGKDHDDVTCVAMRYG